MFLILFSCEQTAVQTDVWKLIASLYIIVEHKLKFQNISTKTFKIKNIMNKNVDRCRCKLRQTNVVDCNLM